LVGGKGLVSVGLTSWLTVGVAAAMVVALTLATLLLWGRLGDTGIARWPLRGALLVAGQLSAVVLVGLILNRIYAFYVSWPELLGQHAKVSAAQPDVGSLDARWEPQIARAYREGHGIVISIPIPGLRSGVAAGPALVYLPPQYGDPSHANRTFPVVELLAGFPGSPETWTNRLHVASILDQEIAAGRTVPFIAVMPTQTVGKPRDAECVNVVNGPQLATYLTDDVRTGVEKAFRASSSLRQWTLMGYSTGGYCAANLATRHPEMFHAAVSIAGYNAAAHDGTTGDLFAKNPIVRDDNSPLWRAEHLTEPNLDLLLITTKSDRYSVVANDKLARAARPPLRIWTLTLPRGGHNTATFSAELPVAFGWLSRFVSAPLADIPAVDGQLPAPVFNAPPRAAALSSPVVHSQRAHR
jgi:enterochelin esterase-like enzyme